MKTRVPILIVASVVLALILATGCDVARPFTPLTSTPIVPSGTVGPMETPGPTTMPSTTTPVAPVPTFTPLVPTTPGAAVATTVAPAETPVLPTAAPAPGPAGQVSPPGAGEQVYVVEWGDTLSAIAWRYGTTVSAIAQRNGITDPSHIYVGQRLIIPADGGQPSPDGTQIHIVQRGETLSYIAWKYGTTVAAIAQANSIWNVNLIYVGQRLVIPSGGGGEPGPGRKYVVQPGDTLSSIALQFGTTAMAIAMANNLPNPSLIYPGQVLIIP